MHLVMVRFALSKVSYTGRQFVNRKFCIPVDCFVTFRKLGFNHVCLELVLQLKPFARKKPLEP